MFGHKDGRIEHELLEIAVTIRRARDTIATLAQQVAPGTIIFNTALLRLNDAIARIENLKKISENIHDLIERVIQEEKR